MAAALAREASSWTRARLTVVNAAFVTDREALVSFSVRKLLLLARYLVSSVVVIRRVRAPAAIVTPSFYAGPFVKDAVMIFLLRALTGTRIVAWVHMDPSRLELEHKPWWYRRLATFALRRVDLWVGCAQTLVDQWPAFIPRDRRIAVANGLPEGPDEQVRSRGGESSAFRVCSISALDESKGWTDLLSVADEVCDAHAAVEFHFCGDVGVGLTKRDVQRRFEACRFADRILWHGPVRGPEKWTRLRTSDLFCLPSRTEQFPIVLLEAMASGLPIVATRVGAVEEAVVEGKGGWLVAPGFPELLRSAIEEALRDRARLERFGEFNALRQRKYFSITRFGAEWEQVLADMAIPPVTGSA